MALPHAQRVKIVREIALTGAKDAVDLTACRALIETYPKGYFKDVMIERAAHQVLKSLVDRILIISESALSLRRRIDDRNARVAMFLLEGPAIHNDIAATGDARCLEWARQAWTSAGLDPRRDLIRHYRNKAVAHRSDIASSKRAPFIDEVYTIAGRVSFMLAQLATGVGIQVDASMQNLDHIYSAQGFWRAWRVDSN
jgi:hypothetical protein